MQDYLKFNVNSLNGISGATISGNIEFNQNIPIQARYCLDWISQDVTNLLAQLSGMCIIQVFLMNLWMNLMLSPLKREK